ncbi:MAG: hypothetical protein EPN47_10290 [Acidobacteria bacterium]|nr:MAG: hypothetical protein EPN47_10290 [Acidobacteriota bacterium]
MRNWGNTVLCAILVLGLTASAGLAGQMAHGQSSGLGENETWHAMGSAPCAWLSPIQNPDHSLNVERTIILLHDFGFECAALPISGGPPTDWANFKKLLSAAQTADIDLWAILIPPTEGGDSHPYDTDFVKWFQTLAELSLKYPHLRGANIDDLLIDGNKQIFTHGYLSTIYHAKQMINPHFLFVPTVYELDQGIAKLLEGCVDGVWFWWMNLERGEGLSSFLENARVVVGKRFPVYAGIYAHAASWHREGEPSVRAFLSSIEAGCRNSDGVIIWNLSFDPNDPLLQIAKCYTRGGSAKLAGRCGE